METLISLLAGTAIAAILIPTLAHVVHTSEERNRQAITSGELQDLMVSARNFAENHRDEILANVNVGGTFEVPLNQMPLLPNFNSSNPYGQSWHIYMQQPSSGQVSAIITTRDGDEIKLPALTHIVALSGNHAGYVGPDDTVPGVDSQTAIGAAGGWHLPLNGSPINPGAGHLFAIATTSSAVQYNTDALYRNAVPNHPELNTMNTSLNMNGNNIGNANNIGGNSETLNGAIGTNGLDPNNGIPSNWGGGVHTHDVYAEGSIGAGPRGGPPKAWLNDQGDADFER
uniref:shufflon system plasmid conjugative transfer pilus tip adhesin PilV n=3 Tax=Neokomagataea TaxID=1223423 RepID=UPI0022658670